MNPAPDKLSDAAKVHWDRLQAEGKDADADLLTAYCTTLAQYDEAQAKIQEFGLVVVSFSGAMAPNTYVGIANVALGRMLQLQKAMGMGDMESPAKKSADDDLAAAMARGDVAAVQRINAERQKERTA